MLGRTHFKIGILSYAIASTAPIISDRLLHTNGGISLVGLTVAGIGALMVDADSRHSRINRANPVTGIMDKGIEFAERALKAAAKLFFTIGLGILVLFYSMQIISGFSSVRQLQPFGAVITYGTAFILILVGILNERALRYLPVIGMMYKDTTAAVDKAASILKRIWMLFVYIGAGAGFIIYNIFHTGSLPVYCIGILFIAIAVFPHRSFLHSIEGVVIFSLAVSYLFDKYGFGYLTGAFIIGYASHIYWADILTKEGVPLLSLPRFIAKPLERLGIHNRAVRILRKTGEIRLRIPLMSTGTKHGNMFESIYTLVLMAIAAALFIANHATIRL